MVYKVYMVYIWLYKDTIKFSYSHIYTSKNADSRNVEKNVYSNKLRTSSKMHKYVYDVLVFLKISQKTLHFQDRTQNTLLSLW